MISKLNLLQSEKGRLIQNESVSRRLLLSYLMHLSLRPKQKYKYQRSSARQTKKQHRPRLVQVYKSDVSDLQSELEAMRKALDRERIRGGELEAKLASLDQDMAFQLQVGAGYQIAVSLFTNSQPSHYL